MPQKGLSDKLKADIKFRKKVIISSILIYFFVGYYFFPFRLPVMDTLLKRLVFTFRLQLFGGFTLIMGMMGVIFVRGQSDATADPIKGNAEHLTEVSKNIFQNTLEQYLMHFIGQMVLCTFLSSESMKAIPLLVALFVVGRIVFKFTYQKDSSLRLYGFAPTVLPTFATYAYCTYCLLVYGPGYGFEN